MAIIEAISMRETANACTLKIKVAHVKRTTARIWLFTALLRLAVLVCPMTVEVEHVS